MFEIHGDVKESDMKWYPILDSDTVYAGQIVKHSAEGVTPIGVAAGAYDTTNKALPHGIVVGMNTYPPIYNATYGDYVTDESPHGLTTDRFSTTSVSPLGDRQALARVILIKPNTIIKARIFNATIGVAPTVGTVSLGSADGLSCTSSAVDVNGIANLGTIYFRTGANKGVYRVTDDTSTTALTWDKPTPSDVAIGDTLVRVNLRVGGLSRVQFDSESMFINCAAACTADYYGIVVTALDLSVAGAEYVEFYFAGDHFCPARA